MWRWGYKHFAPLEQGQLREFLMQAVDLNLWFSDPSTEAATLLLNSSNQR
jgi:hypothetical protein